MSEHICKYECTGTTFVTCSICDHEIYTEQLIESLQSRLKASQDEVERLEKIVDDFDGSVRHLMTAAPQLEIILKNNQRRIKNKP